MTIRYSFIWGFGMQTTLIVKYYKLFVEFTDEYFEGKYKLKIWTDNGGADGNNFCACMKEVDLVGEARENNHYILLLKKWTLRNRI